MADSSENPAPHAGSSDIRLVGCSLCRAVGFSKDFEQCLEDPNSWRCQKCAIKELRATNAKLTKNLQRLDSFLNDINMYTLKCDKCGWIDDYREFHVCHSISTEWCCGHCSCDKNCVINDEGGEEAEGDEGDEGDSSEKGDEMILPTAL